MKKTTTTTATMIKRMNKMPRNSFMREQFVILYSSQPIVSIRILKTMEPRLRNGGGRKGKQEERWLLKSGKSRGGCIAEGETRKRSR